MDRTRVSLRWIPSSYGFPHRRTIVSQLFGTTSLSAFTDNDGETYSVSQGGGIASGVDHQTVGGGPFRLCTADQLLVTPVPCAQLAVRGPLTQYPNAVYYASQDIGDAEMALSQDGGLTYEEAHPMYTLVDCGGLHGHIKVSSSGIVYVSNKRCGSTQGLIVSMDNGLTFTVQPVTGSTPNSSDPSIGIGSKGRVYFGLTLRAMDIRTSPFPMTRDAPGTMTRMLERPSVCAIRCSLKSSRATMTARPSSSWARLRLADGTGADTGTPFNGVWHGYIATTYNGGKTWFTVDATPNDPCSSG